MPDLSTIINIDMPNEFWAAIAGAVVGALVTGIISYFVQLNALSATRKQREQDAKEKKQALGHSLLFKMIRIHSTIYQLNLHIEEQLSKLDEPEHKGWEPWQVMLPIANLTSHVHFSTEEMAMLLSLKDDDLFNQVAAFDDIHNSDIELFRKQADLREWLNERLPAVMNGEVGEIRLTQEQAMYVRPKMVEMNSLIRAMEGRCKQDVEQAWDMLIKLGKLLNDKLDLNVNIISKEEYKKEDEKADSTSVT